MKGLQKCSLGWLCSVFDLQMRKQILWVYGAASSFQGWKYIYSAPGQSSFPCLHFSVFKERPSINCLLISCSGTRTKWPGQFWRSSLLLEQKEFTEQMWHGWPRLEYQEITEHVLSVSCREMSCRFFQGNIPGHLWPLRCQEGWGTQHLTWAVSVGRTTNTGFLPRLHANWPWAPFWVNSTLTWSLRLCRWRVWTFGVLLAVKGLPFEY